MSVPPAFSIAETSESKGNKDGQQEKEKHRTRTDKKRRQRKWRGVVGGLGVGGVRVFEPALCHELRD